MRARARGVRRVFAWGLSLGAGLACASAPAPVALPPAAGAPERLILISVSGLDAQRLASRENEAPTLPNLSALASAGAYAERVVGVAPASTYPAHATLLTGALPATHGVVADRRLGVRGVRRAAFSHASHLRVATLWQRIAEAGGEVASLDWPSTRGAAIAQLLPDGTPQPGAGWLEQIGDAATPALRERAEAHGGAEPEAAAPGPARDAVLGDLACELLGGSRPPQLLLLRLSGTAPALTSRGPGSAEAAAAFASLDGRVGALLDCLRGADRLASSVIAVVGDHGIIAAHTAIAANVALVEAGLISVDEVGVVAWDAITRANGGSAFVYARDDSAAVRARLALVAASEQTGAFRVVSAEEMIRQGADPEAWFGLEAEPGFAFGEAVHGELLRASERRGVGGYLPERPEMDAVLVLWGATVRTGLRIPRMGQTDVAPTLARVLGVELDAVEGRPLVGVLEARPSVSAPGAQP